MYAWKHKRLSEDYLELAIEAPRVTGEPFWILLISDVHFDSNHCDRELLKQHLEEALNRNAPILSFGDFFDVMQGKYDPRKDYKGLRPEYTKDVHISSCYLDDVIDDAIEFLKPYSSHIKLLSDGNHEVTIKSRLQTNLTQRLIDGLRYHTKNKIINGYEAGVIRLKMTDPGNPRANITGPLIGYDHGEGTKSAVAVERWMRDRPDVDIMVVGHFHTAEYSPKPVIRYSPKGFQHIQKRALIRIPGYKNEGGVREGWARKNKAIRPTLCGGQWLKCEYHRSSNSIRFTVEETSELI